jgi:hypothetical protein
MGSEIFQFKVYKKKLLRHELSADDRIIITFLKKNKLKMNFFIHFFCILSNKFNKVEIVIKIIKKSLSCNKT